MAYFKKILYALVITVALFLTGCASTSTVYTKTFEKPASPISKINVIYIDSHLKAKGSSVANDLSDIGYADFPGLLRKQVPIVFGLNNIKAKYATFDGGDFGQIKKMDSPKWANDAPGSMILTLQVTGGYSAYGRHTLPTTALNLQANLIDPKTKMRQWTGQFRIRFLEAPVGKSGFDNASVDKLLKQVLEQLAKDGMIALANGQAVIPPS